MIDHLSGAERLTWARAFRNARMSRALTQEELAEASDVDVRTIQRIESEGRGSSASFRSLADGLGTTLPSLVNDSICTTLTLAIMNEKGGVGRTTICLNLAGYLAKTGHRVLLVQASDEESLFTVWCHRPKSLPQIDCCVTPSVDCIDAVLASAKSYDVVLVDGVRYSPKMNNAIIRRASAILIPLGPSMIDVWGTEVFLEQTRQIRPMPPLLAVLNQIDEGEDDPDDLVPIIEALQPLLRTHGMALARTRIPSREIFRNVCGKFGSSLFDIIDRGISVHDAAASNAQRVAASELESLWSEVLAACGCCA